MKKTYKYLIRFASGLLLIIALSNCKNTDIVPPVHVITTPGGVNLREASDVHKFIYNGLRDYYLWNSQVTNLIAPKFMIKDSLNAFLNSYTDPNKLFTDLLYKYHKVDKWSFVVDDSKVIDDWIQGISETMGFDFMLSYFGSGNNIFGLVRYVYKGSPAEKAGIKRGDYFMKVDDVQLTDANYQTLLFTKLTYKLSFANITGSRATGYQITLNGKSATITAVLMQENPIQLDTVLNIGNFKIGYLVYNGFNADFDIQLNDVFKRFKEAGINKLVVDLRYNGGGSVQSAKYLASMIYGTATSKVFLKSVYNAGLQEEIIRVEGAASLNQNFKDKIDSTAATGNIPINTLGMSKVYVITSDNTASASELLINGLKPYMDVVQVGDTTVGKYVGSWTIKDWNSNGNVNPNHKWAMQPIVVKIANSQGQSDYVDGLFPLLKMEEDFTGLFPFGDQNETLLKVVLNDIKGLPQSSITLKSQTMLKKVFDSQDARPFSKQMYVNPILKNRKN